MALKKADDSLFKNSFGWKAAGVALCLQLILSHHKCRWISSALNPAFIHPQYFLRTRKMNEQLFFGKIRRNAEISQQHLIVFVFYYAFVKVKSVT